MTEAQAIHKVYQMFKEAGETAAADSPTTYILLGNNIPSFSHILYDIDNLFKVNGVSNALDSKRIEPQVQFGHRSCDQDREIV